MVICPRGAHAALIASLLLGCRATGQEPPVQVQPAAPAPAAEAAHSHAGHGPAPGGAGPGPAPGAAPAPGKPKSPRLFAMATVGGTHIHVDYGAPSVRGRQIFGGLVAYGEVWVAGAHKATNVAFDHDVVIGTTQIPAGKYGFFAIPGQDQWTLILNRTWDMHLADDYRQADDVVRLQVIPQTLAAPVEQLTYEVSTTDGTRAVVALSWANVRVAFEVRTVRPTPRP